MSDKDFLDTNILVYAYDSNEPEKQQRAQSLLTQGIQREKAVISAQVLGEFFTVVTSRILAPLSADEAGGQIDLFGLLPVVELDLKLVKRAVLLHK